MSNVPLSVRDHEIVFGYNWWLPVVVAAIGAVIAVIMGARILFACVGITTLAAIAASFTFRTVLNKDGISMHYMWSWRRHWMTWADIHRITTYSPPGPLQDFRDIAFELKGGKVFRASLIGTRAASRLLTVLELPISTK